VSRDHGCEFVVGRYFLHFQSLGHGREILFGGLALGGLVPVSLPFFNAFGLEIGFKYAFRDPVKAYL
jgi:hypothetical protein